MYARIPPVKNDGITDRNTPSRRDNRRWRNAYESVAADHRPSYAEASTAGAESVWKDRIAAELQDMEAQPDLRSAIQGYDDILQLDDEDDGAPKAGREPKLI